MKVTDAPYYRVELTPAQTAEVTEIGTGRTQAWGDGEDAPHYADKTKRQDDLTADIAAAACECAAALLLGLNWTGSTVWHKTDHDHHARLPDIGENTEVRRIRYPDAHTFAVRARDKGKIMVAAYAEPPEHKVIRILGWVNATTALKAGFRTEHGYVRAPLTCLTLTHPDAELPALRVPTRLATA